MGKFLNKFKDKAKDLDKSLEKPISSQNVQNSRFRKSSKDKIGSFSGSEEMDYDDYPEKGDDYFDDVGVQPSQKPESFHHFILENQYKDLEKSIRGVKDVWNKEEQKWITKRKDIHCFTDEEAEDILRTAQSHLATDIKLGRIRKDSFGDLMDALYKELAFLFESIAEYRYGRYGSYEKQYAMKLQNQKIFLELWTRVQMNYSRAIDSAENKATHQSVRGQESLQSGDRDYTNRNMGYN